MATYNDIFEVMNRLAEEKAAEEQRLLQRARAVACGAVAPCGKAEEFLHRIYSNLDYEREQRRKGLQVIRNLQAEIEQLKADLEDAHEKLAAEESDRIDKAAIIERLHEQIEKRTELDKALEVIRKQKAEIEQLKSDHLQTLKQLDEQKEQLDELTARNKYLEANSELQLAQWQEDTKQLLSLKNMAYTVHRQLEAAMLVHFLNRTLTTDEHRLLAKLERIAAKANPYPDDHDDE